MSNNNANAANSAMVAAFWLAREADQDHLERLGEEIQRQLAARTKPESLRDMFHRTQPQPHHTGLELYALNMAAPGIASRFSHEQMGRFLAASLEVEAKALAMADPATAAALADYDRRVRSLVDECKARGGEFGAELVAELSRVIQRRSVIVELNRATHERAAVNALLAEGAGQGVSHD